MQPEQGRKHECNCKKTKLQRNRRHICILHTNILMVIHSRMEFFFFFFTGKESTFYCNNEFKRSSHQGILTDRPWASFLCGLTVATYDGIYPFVLFVVQMSNVPSGIWGTAPNMTGENPQISPEVLAHCVYIFSGWKLSKTNISQPLQQMQNGVIWIITQQERRENIFRPNFNLIGGNTFSWHSWTTSVSFVWTLHTFIITLFWSSNKMIWIFLPPQQHINPYKAQ